MKSRFVLESQPRKEATGSVRLHVAAMVTLLQAACAIEHPDAVKQRVLRADDRGAEVNLARDELLTIELDARLSTGLTWELVELDSSVLVLAAREHESAPGLGGIDRERLYFTALTPGKTTVTLAYHRPWEEVSADDERYSVTLQVDGPYVGPWVPPEPQALATQALGADAAPASLNLCDPGDGGYSRCTPIKNQGNCGGCWAFATTGVFENLLYFANPSIQPNLSEQYLISCNSEGYDCASGGNVAFDYYTKDYVSPPETAAGAVYTSDFPYKAADVACGSQAHPHHEKLTSWASLGRKPSIATLKDAIMNAGPVWTAVCADSAFDNYKYKGNSSSDIFRGTCTNLNHAVVLVGWNDNGGDGYWLMRNSWGNKWGERGYMRIAYGASGIGSESYKAVYGSQPPTNSAPAANAGAGQTVSSGDPVTLDGSASRDPDGTIASYSWVAKGTPMVTLTGADTAKPTFVAPAVNSATGLTFTLTVTDNRGATGAASVVVTVKPENRPPVANAGLAQNVTQGATVTLDGASSSDPDGTIVKYAWSQTAGPATTLTDPATKKPTFVAASTGTLTFTLTVTDDAGATASQTVAITVLPPNRPPVADAGAAQRVHQGVTVRLDGSGSSDPDGSIARYAWSQNGGTSVVLNETSTARPTFAAPAVMGDITLLLTVTDNQGASTSASVVVTVVPAGEPIGSAGGAAGEDESIVGSCSAVGPPDMGLVALSLVLSAWFRRRCASGR